MKKLINVLCCLIILTTCSLFLNSCQQQKFDVSKQFHERKKPFLTTGFGTAGTGISCRKIAVDNDNISVTIPYDGKYLVMGRGSYRNIAFGNVDVTLYVNYTNSDQPIFKKVIGTNINNRENSATPTTSVLVGTFQKELNLKKGDEIELRYGNNKSTTEQYGFSFAYPEDYLIAIKLD